MSKQKKSIIPSIKSVPTLYRKPIRATRGGPLFNAFPYPTKISPETIALFIASHTKPGDTVLDCFAGSGTTGLGAILCERPSVSMKQQVEALKLPVEWGPRNVVLFEIGVLGAFIAQVLSSPPDPVQFRISAEKILADIEKKYNWIYEAQSPQREKASIRYIIWSDILLCPSCRKRVTLWDACVSRNPAKISETFKCPKCNYESALAHIRRLTSNMWDDHLCQNRMVRLRQPVWVYGSTNGRAWSRSVQSSDLRLLKRIESEPINEFVPERAIPWGDLYRSGYHEGITHLHHFYTRRNLIVFSALWSQAQKQPANVRDALRFWLLSYNASHATIMTRVVAKKDQNDLVVTSGQPGVLYISGLPVEKNIFAGLRRKLKTIGQAFEITYGKKSSIKIQNSSCLSLGLDDESVDYIFTDPPFGGNIPYAEVNFLNEAWLGKVTDFTDEVTISPHQGKTVDDYHLLLYHAFKEAYRVLKHDSEATVVFHSASAQVWNALRTACEKAGFGVTSVSVLDKTQGSFKQVTTQGAVRGDPLILLSKNHKPGRNIPSDLLAIVDDLIKQALLSKDPIEMSPQRIFSRLVGYYITGHQELPISAKDFYQILELKWKEHGSLH